MRKLIAFLILAAVAAAQPVTLSKNPNSGANPNQLTTTSGTIVVGAGQSITAINGGVIQATSVSPAFQVPYTQVTAVPTAKLLGRTTALTGAAEAITVGASLSFSALTLELPDTITAGSAGSSTAIPVLTFDAKGRLTAASTAAVIAPAGTLTGTTLAANVVSSSLTSVGTIGTGTWQGSLVAGQYGGTGVANTGKTITLGGNLTTSGAFASTFTMTNTTAVTFPTTGTLATITGEENLTNKTVNGLILNAGNNSPLDNIAIGNNVLVSNTTGNSTVGIGTRVLRLSSTAFANTAIGFEAMSNVIGGVGLAGSYNTAFGYYALRSILLGHENVAVGEYAMHDLTDGSANTGIGGASNRLLKTGNGNIAVGHGALTNNITGSNNTGLGWLVAAGIASGSYSNNTFVGALSASTVTTGSNNTFIGLGSGGLITTASNNVLVGYQTGAANGGSSSSLTTGSGNVAIGYNIDLPDKTGDSQLVISNAIYGTGLSGSGTTISTGKIGLFGTPTGSERLQIFVNTAITGTLSSTSTISASNGFTSIASGSFSAIVTLSSVSASGGSAFIKFRDDGNDRWNLGYNIAGVNFGLYDYTATAGLALSVTAGSKDASFRSVTEATTGGAAGLKSLGGIYATKRIITASTLTTASGIAYDFGAYSASSASPTGKIRMIIAGATYDIPAQLVP